MEEKQNRKIVLLIDIENVQSDLIESSIKKVEEKYGKITCKRAYGDYSKSNLKNIQNVLISQAIIPVHNITVKKGKNSSDFALVIDAMDLMYSKKYDTFVIMTSDSDFTRLVMRLRNEDVFVIGVGETKSSQSFIAACDDFGFMDDNEDISEKTQKQIVKNQNNQAVKSEEQDVVATKNKKQTSKSKKTTTRKEIKENNKVEDDKFSQDDKNHIIDLIKNIPDTKFDKDKWITTNNASRELKKLDNEFSPKKYGFSGFEKLLKALSDFIEFDRTDTQHKKIRFKQL